MASLHFVIEKGMMHYYGISVKKMFALTWVLSGVIGGLGGILLTSSTYLNPTIMGNFLTSGMTAAVIGGLMSVPGAFVGGIILGICENLVSGFISIDWADAIAGILIIVVLAVRPTGIFGRTKQRRI